MAKRLQSEIRNPPNRQFTHFGVLDDGGQNKTAFFGSIIFNVLLALIALIIGASVKKVVDNRDKNVTLIVPIKTEPKPEPPKPKIVPPKLPPPPKLEPKLEPPKITVPEVKIPDPPKPIPVAVPKPVPVITPAPPKVIAAAAAPKVVQVNMGKAASIPNNDPHPAAISLGRTNSPVAPMSGPAVAAVNLGGGAPGMPPGSGRGPAATSVNMGSGQPNGGLSGAPRAVAGVALGCNGCNGKPGGNGNATQVAQIKLGGNTEAAPSVTKVAAAPVRTAPQVLYKPKPVYTAEATAMHLEGTVSVKIRVSASGAVTVLAVTSGLGHGLDESARQCAQNIRFKPAVDASGNPVDWEGTVTISFQMA